MSLIPYNDDSLILKDSNSNSLVIVNPQKGKLSLFERVNTAENSYFNLHSANHRSDPLRKDIGNGFQQDDYVSHETENKLENHSISVYTCPVCGTKIDNGLNMNDATTINNSTTNNTTSNYKSANFQFPYNFPLNEKYFQFLEATFKRHAINDKSNTLNNSINESSIPFDLFTPGYFHKFFKVLSLLGNGARGSVFKVIHKIGDTELGIFALKKISIGNDMVWFNKCIREVKALSSITHKSNNLITYNHVWLEMDKSYGVTDNKVDSDNNIIPCLFILQQFCPGGNLEDCILVEVFKKFPERISKDRRKVLFRQRRKNKMDNIKIKPGLNTIQILHIIRDLTRGLHELHDLNIIHRDLKPSNCLLLSSYKQEDLFDNPNFNESDSNKNTHSNLNSFPTVVIGDLGESQILGELRTATGCTGTVEYTAPEIIINDSINNNRFDSNYSEFSFASDMYSLGMVIYFIVFGSLPFTPDSDLDDLKHSVKQFHFNKERMIERHEKLSLNPIDLRIFDLIESLVNPDPNARPSASVVELNVDNLLISLTSEEIYTYTTAANTRTDNETHGNNSSTSNELNVGHDNLDFVNEGYTQEENFTTIDALDKPIYSTNLISTLHPRKDLLALTAANSSYRNFFTGLQDNARYNLLLIAVLILFLSFLHLSSLIHLLRYIIVFAMGYFFRKYAQKLL